ISALNSSSFSVYSWNNVFDARQGGSYATLVEDGALASLQDQNNIYIVGAVTTGSGGSIVSHVTDHNISWFAAQANAAGFMAGNLYYNPANSAAVTGGTNAPS